MIQKMTSPTRFCNLQTSLISEHKTVQEASFTAKSYVINSRQCAIWGKGRKWMLKTLLTSLYSAKAVPATADPPTPTIATVIVATLAKGSSLGRSLVISGAENGSAANKTVLLATANSLNARHTTANTLCIKCCSCLHCRMPAGSVPAVPTNGAYCWCLVWSLLMFPIEGPY